MLWQKDDSQNSDIYIDICAEILPDACLTEKHGTFKRPKARKDELLAKQHREDGKKLFAKKNYVEAMQEFNRCLMFAPQGSEEVALAYANRSACFFYLNMFEECMVDIERAKKSNYPANLIDKLKTRATKCEISLEKKVVKPVLFTIREPLLSFDEHDKFDGVANCLEIQTNDTIGRHVVTTRDLEIGQTILVERPYAIVATDFSAQNRDRCFQCFRKWSNLISCDDCLVGSYCNENCLAKSFHKFECNMETLSGDEEKSELVIKIFLKTNAAFADVDDLMSTVDLMLNGHDVAENLTTAQRNFCSLFQLVRNHEKYSNQLSRKLTSRSTAVYLEIAQFQEFNEKFVTNKHRRFAQHLILHLFYIVEHAIELHEHIRNDTKSILASYSLEHYASGLYPVGCWIKHSCVPNVCWFSVDDRLICRVIWPIKKGEQIFRSYLPGMESFMRDPKLKVILNDRYHVKCECYFCCRDMWSPIVDRFNLREDPLWKDGIAPIFMEVAEFRQLSLEIIETHEQNTIEFLQKYANQRQIRDNISMQESLQVMWNVIASYSHF